MAKTPRYRLKDSDRSGFTYREIELTRDDGSLVGPDEFDTPPPSKRPLGGEGDINPGDTRFNYDSTETTSENNYTVQYVTTATKINYIKGSDASGSPNPNFGWIYISGLNRNIVLNTQNPQVTAGSHLDKATLECVGSSVTLINGSGLSLRNNFSMDSGAILNLIYNATDNLWYETSRGHQTKNLGEF